LCEGLLENFSPLLSVFTDASKKVIIWEKTMGAYTESTDLVLRPKKSMSRIRRTFNIPYQDFSSGVKSSNKTRCTKVKKVHKMGYP
jgi:hypothetical protein